MTAKPFKPKKLGRESLDTPLEPQWRVMGADQEKRLHERTVEQYRRFQVWGPRMRRRLRIYVLGTAAGFAVVGWLFLLATWRTLWIFGGVGAALGAVVAVLRPSDFLCGLLYALTGLAGSVILMRNVGLGAIGIVLSCTLFFFVVGVALGRVEEFKRLDGED